MARTPHSNAIGFLMYAKLSTRLDIFCTIELLSRFQSNTGLFYWNAVKRALRYLRSTIDYILCYGRSDLRFHGYIDVDYARDMDERKSTFAYTFSLRGEAISWCNKKQSVMALSKMEAEYVAALAATQEVIRLRSYCMRQI